MEQDHLSQAEDHGAEAGPSGQPQTSVCPSSLPLQSVEIQAVQSRESKGELLVLKQTSEVDQMTCVLLLPTDTKESLWWLA